MRRSITGPKNSTSNIVTMLLLAILYALLFWPAVVAATFGWTQDGDEYVIDSGADLVIRVNTCCGDITSLLYKGVEYQGYSGKNTHVVLRRV